VNEDHQDTAICRLPNVGCSARDTKLGVMGRYHFVPDAQVSPWIGYGLGWEWGSFLTRSSSALNLSGDADWSGIEFANVQLGGDIRIHRLVVVAPFFSLSFGRFDSRSGSGAWASPFFQNVGNESVHEWIFLGVRVAVMP